METLTIYEIFGYISGFLFAGSLIPQLYKSCKTKKLDDISYCWQLTFLSGMILNLIYSYHENLMPVFIPASFEASFMGLLLFMKIYYHKPTIEESEEDNREYP
tara:strand:+ start:340 stop:648 length:309 start_codon:yes stop_codon:yes gene_type:complete